MTGLDWPLAESECEGHENLEAENPSCYYLLPMAMSSTSIRTKVLMVFGFKTGELGLGSELGLGYEKGRLRLNL